MAGIVVQQTWLGKSWCQPIHCSRFRQWPRPRRQRRDLLSTLATVKTQWLVNTWCHCVGFIQWPLSLHPGGSRPDPLKRAARAARKGENVRLARGFQRLRVVYGQVFPVIEEVDAEADRLDYIEGIKTFLKAIYRVARQGLTPVDKFSEMQRIQRSMRAFQNVWLANHTTVPEECVLPVSNFEKYLLGKEALMIFPDLSLGKDLS